MNFLNIRENKTLRFCPNISQNMLRFTKKKMCVTKLRSTADTLHFQNSISNSKTSQFLSKMFQFTSVEREAEINVNATIVCSARSVFDSVNIVMEKTTLWTIQNIWKTNKFKFVCWIIIYFFRNRISKVNSNLKPPA